MSRSTRPSYGALRPLASTLLTSRRAVDLCRVCSCVCCRGAGFGPCR